MNTALSTQVHNVYPANPVFVDNPNPVFDPATGQYISSKIIRFVADEYIRDVKNNKRTIEDFYKGLSKIGESDARSLLYISNILQGRSWENISFDSDDYGNQLIFHLKNCNNPLEEFNNLVRRKIDTVLPETYLEWFKNDLRCSLFLAHLINYSIVDKVYKGRQELIQAVANILRYEIHIFINEYRKNLPNYSLIVQEKGDRRTAYIESVKSIYLKNRTENFDWIDPKNDQMIDWSYKYLCGKGREYIILKGIFVPENTQEKYELILASLDVLSNVDDPSIGTKNKKGFSLRAYVLFSMEKAWRSQKQYANKNPSSENDSVKIYKQNIPKLEALMAYSGLTLKQMVNNSIEQMYDQLIANNSDPLDKDDASG